MQRRLGTAALFGAAACLALAAGCASYEPLMSEDSVPSLKESKAVFTQRCAEAVLVESGPTSMGPTRLATYQLGADHPRVVVLIHGMFTDSSSYRHLAGLLAPDQDLLLIDLPGCGASDKPTPRAMGKGGYGPDALARRVLTVLRDRLGPSARPDQPSIALVGHSYGSGIILRMFGNEDIRHEFDDVLARVDRAVLMSGMDFAVGQPNADLVKVWDASSWEVGLANLTGILDRSIANSVREGFTDVTYAVKEEADLRKAILRDDARRWALQGMLDDAVPYVRKPGGRLTMDWEAVDKLEAGYSLMDVPTLILWGSRDEVLPISMAYKLDRLIPESRLEVIQGGKHSIHMERAKECSDAMREFFAEGVTQQ